MAITTLGFGCAPAYRASADTIDVEPHENMPAAASVWLTAEPAVVHRLVTVELSTADAGFRRSETFPPGTVIRTSFGVSSGAYRLSGLDGACATDLTLVPERERDVVLRIGGDAGCALVTVRQHGAEVTHEAPGTLTAHVTASPGGTLLVDVRSLDEPLNQVPDPVPPDEGRLAIVEPLWPGRYEVRLLRDGQPIETTEITIDKREPAGDFVELILDGLP